MDIFIHWIVDGITISNMIDISPKTYELYILNVFIWYVFIMAKYNGK